MEMVERVARAISVAIKYNDVLAHYSYEQRQAEMNDVARAAIEAMREPTPEMLDALNAKAQCIGYLPEGYDAMIDAALPPKVESEK